MTEEEQVVFDKIGQEIRLGSIVAAPNGKSSMILCRVIKIMPKKIRIEEVGNELKSYKPNWDKMHDQVICLDDLEQTVMHLMTQNL
jgi:hypothetical protein